MIKRNYSIDALKFFCIIGVICIHTQPFMYMDIDFVGNRYLGIIINTIARASVPLFFVSSGYIFYIKASKDYTKKYIINLFKVLISWTIIYIFYDTFIIIISNIVNKRYILNEIQEYFSGFNISNIYYATGIIKYHLWYLLTMIIITPVLYLIIKKKIVNKVIVIALVLNIIGVWIPVFINNSLWIKVRDALFFGLFYFTLGVYIKENEYKFNQIIDKLSKSKHIISILFLLGVSIIERYIYIIMFNGCGDYFISTIPSAVLIFGLCLRNPNLFKYTMISKLGKKTLGIYVIHPLIMNIISLILVRLKLDWILSTIVWQFIYTPIVLVISYMSYEVIQCIKSKLVNMKIENEKVSDDNYTYKYN